MLTYVTTTASSMTKLREKMRFQRSIWNYSMSWPNIKVFTRSVIAVINFRVFFEMVEEIGDERSNIFIDSMHCTDLE